MIKKILLSGVLLFSPSIWSKESKVSTGNPKVVIETSEGDITVELFQDKAPESVANFLQYVDSGFYDKTIFHRVIDGFMIQGGGFTEDMTQKPTKKPIKNESKNGISNTTGTLAMARTNDPDSATAQFFINVANNGFLDKKSPQSGGGYAVFGKVIDKGMDVVNKIKGIATTTKGPYENVPQKAMVIKKIKRM